MADEYEKERVQALSERRTEEFAGSDHRSLEARFGPGSFGCHEALHVTQVVVDMIDRELLSHSAVLLNPFWYGKVREAQASLRSAYNAVADNHLAASLPVDDSGQKGPTH